MTNMFYVYVLHSVADNGFYIGFTADLKRRVSEHKKGASFATSYRGHGDSSITKRTQNDSMRKGESGT
jgi:predicted GIY-YIG superfamily endonuclease